jgi:hypothetical protein
MTQTLSGIRREGWRARAAVTRFTAKSLARNGQVAYSVTQHSAPTTPAPAPPRDTRVAERRRSRLRSAKLLDSNNRFICECLIHDLSSHGVGLKLMNNIGLPPRLRLFDDETGELHVAAIAWRRGVVLGLRLRSEGAKPSIKSSLRLSLRGQYYAIPD